MGVRARSIRVPPLIIPVGTGRIGVGSLITSVGSLTSADYSAAVNRVAGWLPLGVPQLIYCMNPVGHRSRVTVELSASPVVFFGGIRGCG